MHDCAGASGDAEHALVEIAWISVPSKNASWTRQSPPSTGSDVVGCGGSGAWLIGAIETGVPGRVEPAVEASETDQSITVSPLGASAIIQTVGPPEIGCAGVSLK